MYKEDDVVTVLHHDWMPKGRVVEQMGKVKRTLLSEDKKIGEMVLCDVYAHNGTVEGSCWYKAKATSKDYYWIKEGWDGKPTGEPEEKPTLEEKASRITEEETKKVKEAEDGGTKEGKDGSGDADHRKSKPRARRPVLRQSAPKTKSRRSRRKSVSNNGNRRVKSDL